MHGKLNSYILCSNMAKRHCLAFQRQKSYKDSKSCREKKKKKPFRIFKSAHPLANNCESISAAKGSGLFIWSGIKWSVDTEFAIKIKDAHPRVRISKQDVSNMSCHRLGKELNEHPAPRFYDCFLALVAPGGIPRTRIIPLKPTPSRLLASFLHLPVDFIVRYLLNMPSCPTISTTFVLFFFGLYNKTTRKGQIQVCYGKTSG